MIESFYGKKRMRDPKMATEVTKFGDGDHTTKLRRTIYSLRNNDQSDRAKNPSRCDFLKEKSHS